MAVRSVLALALVALLAAGCGGSGRPHFAVASGWHLLSGPGQTVAAADVPFASSDRSQSLPRRTIASLPPRGVLIWVESVRRGRSAAMDKTYPPRSLPLRVEDGASNGAPEGAACPSSPTSDCIVRSVRASESGWDIDVWTFLGSDHPSPIQIADADAELARLDVPGARMPAVAKTAVRCRRPQGAGYYRSTLTPSAGPEGTTVTVSGRLPVLNEAGRDVGQTATEVAAYWNLDFDHWTSVFNASPRAALAGSAVRFLGTQNVAGRCTYRVRITIPSVPLGTYPVEVLSGDAQGGSSFAPADFRVTSR